MKFLNCACNLNNARVNIMRNLFLIRKFFYYLKKAYVYKLLEREREKEKNLKHPENILHVKE